MRKKSTSLIIRFNYEHLQNEVHVEFHATVNVLFVRFNPETLGIGQLYPAYKSLFDQETEALDEIRKSRHTVEIMKKDRERDQLYRGFADNVKSHRYHFDDATRKAAQRLEFVVDHYGNMARKRLDEKSAAISDLHRELLKPENMALVAALGLDDWLTRFAEANRALEVLMMTRIHELAQRPAINMRSTRRELDKVFRDILGLLEAQVCVKGEGTNEAFIAELNAVMERHKVILAQEAGHRRAARGRAAAAELLPNAPDMVPICLTHIK